MARTSRARMASIALVVACLGLGACEKTQKEAPATLPTTTEGQPPPPTGPTQAAQVEHPLEELKPARVDPDKPKRLEPPTDAQRIAAFTRDYQGLLSGKALLDTPDRVGRGEVFTVKLTVATDEIAKTVDPASGGAIRTDISPVHLTPEMTATLSGLGFRITPEKDNNQIITNVRPTVWVWQVQALESGRRMLLVTLSGTVRSQGESVRSEFYQHSATVEVRVGLAEFIKQYWQWLATTLVIPAVGAGWAFYRKARARPAPTHGD